MIEIHVTLSREMFGPDQCASVTSDELRQLIDGVRFIERMHRGPSAKDDISAETAPLRALFTKSLAPRAALPQGTVLTSEHLALKKPGTGIPEERMAEVIGRRLRRELRVDELIQECDLEDVP